MNNYQKTTIKEILKHVTIRCNVCHSKMIEIYSDEVQWRELPYHTLVGYSCENCPHYNLLDN